MYKAEYSKMYRLEDSHFWFLGKRFFVDSVLVPYQKRIKKILDIGSGTGGMTNHLTKFGKVWGIERDKWGLKFSKKRGLNVVSGKADKLKFRSSEFDLVTLFDVLYHQNIKSEATVITEARRVLKPHGLLLITDSAFNFLNSPHDVVTQGKTRYTLPHMVSLVESQNFKVIKASYIFTSLFPIILLKRLVIDKITRNKTSDVAPVPPLINQILIYVLKIEAKVLNYINLPLGTSVLVLAKKK